MWRKRPLLSQPDPVNAPGNIQRLNLHRKWRYKAIPKTINHVVFFVYDYVATLEFFKNLGIPNRIFSTCSPGSGRKSSPPHPRSTSKCQAAARDST